MRYLSDDGKVFDTDRACCKNEQTDKEFADAIAELMDFEKFHEIEEN